MSRSGPSQLLAPATAIVTGGGAGLGFEAAKALVRAPGWRVVIAARDAAKAEAAARALDGAAGRPCARALPLDLASLDSVRRFVGEIAARGDAAPIRAVVANAGTQHVASTERTRDGFEATLGVNHLGHFLLVNLLLDHVTPPARIVFVSSGTHLWSSDPGGSGPYDRDPGGLIDPDRFRPEPGEGAARVGMRRYATSKLANIYTAYELARRLARRDAPAPVTVNAFDPGMLPGTGLARDHGAAERFAWHALLPLVARVAPGMNTPGRAGAALASLVADPRFGGLSGRYFVAGKDGRPHERASSPLSYDRERAARWWEASARAVGLGGAGAGRAAVPGAP